MEKVKVTKEVADFIERQLSGRSRTEMVRRAAESGILTDCLVQALYVGYEIVLSPEHQQVKDLYESYGGSPSAMERKGGIVETLDALGIKIEGVNA